MRPLGQVEATANRIAHGDLTTRLPDAPYDDEIGRLCKAINQMAEDLTKNGTDVKTSSSPLSATNCALR